MNTEIRNQSTLDLQELAQGTGTIAQCARRILEERAAAEARLSQICREVAEERRG